MASDECHILHGFVRDLAADLPACSTRLEGVILPGIDMNEETLIRSICDCMEMPSFCLQVDADGDVVIAGLSPACEKATGLREKNVAGRRLEEISGLPPESIAVLRANCHRCAETGIPVGCDKQSPLRMGSHSFHAVLVPIHDARGDIRRVVGIIRDTTEPQPVEKALQESRDLLHAIIEAAPTPIIGLDPDGNVQTVWNKAAEKVLGWSASEVMGCPHPAVSAETQDEFRRFGEILRRGGTLEGVEVRRQKRDGTPVDFSLYASPLNDPEGRFTGNISLLVDITQHKRASEELADAHKQLERSLMFDQALLSAIPTPVFYKDREGRYLGCNQAFSEFTGATQEQIAGKTPMEIWPSENAEVYSQKDMDLLQSSGRQTYEFRVRDRDGIDRPVIFAKNVFLDEEGETAGIVGTFVDMTESKRAEEERLAHLRFLECMDRVNRAIQGTNDLEQTMIDVLDVVISIFDCDRSFLMYPCDPEAAFWTASMERTRPGQPLGLEQGLEVPMNPEAAEVMRLNLASDGPVQLGPGAPNPLPPDALERFGIRSSMTMTIYPKIGTPWQFGIHQCSSTRVWTTQEERLFEEIGRRLADSLTSLLTFRDLRQAKELWERTFDAAPDLVAIIDEDFHLVQVNKAMADRLDLSPNTCVGQTCYRVVHGTERPPAFCPHAQSLADGREHIAEIREERLDGDFLVSTSPIFETDDRLIGSVHIARDITERKQAEDALRHSEEEKSVLHQIANIFLTIPDEAIYAEVLAIVLRAMRSGLGLFGYVDKKGDLVIPSLTREVWNECQVPGKSVVFSADSWGDSLWGRALKEKSAFYSDGPFHTPEGHVHVGHFLTVPIVYGQEAIGLISVANKEGGYTEQDRELLERITCSISPILHARLQRDIQEQRRIAAERELKESEEKYRLLITNASEAIFIVQNESVKFPNPAALKMIGYSAEELTEISFANLVHQEDKDAIYEGYAKLLKGQQPEAYPFRIVDKAGKDTWVRLTAATITWENEPAILCFLRDVTEEKKLEAEFMQAQKMEAVGRLAGGVAHDFNNMLTLIVGYTELALMQVTPSDMLHAQLQGIEEAARRSADLTRQLLAFARKQTIAPKILDLNDTVSGMLSMLQRLIGEDIDLVWGPGEHLWPVKVDASQIDQVLANLCVNARDAISGVGKIIIETNNVVFDEAYCANHPGSAPGEHVLLAVSDNGTGMDEETQAHLFEPFFTTKGVGQGTGLGLATVYGIVKQNQGFIDVRTEPQQGTTFTIYLPRHKAEPIETPAESETEVPLGGTEVVLIVEDERAILQLGKRILGGLGYEVLVARTPGEAIRLAEVRPGDIHLLITDVVMPEMNGRALAKRLTAIKPDLKCLYMSGYTADVIAHEGVLEEGVHFVQKPFSMKDLTLKVREVLDERPTNGTSSLGPN